MVLIVIVSPLLNAVNNAEKSIVLGARGCTSDVPYMLLKTAKTRGGMAPSVVPMP